MKVLFLFGPNLGALGRREQSLYGSESLEDIMGSVEERGAGLGHEVGWRLGAGAEGTGAIVINPGALTHYSYALRDAIEASGVPVIEVHMSNTQAREDFRHRSVVSEVCRASIIGLGSGGYHLALEAMPWIT